MAIVMAYIGYKLGISDGYTDGYLEGYDNGHSEGFLEAETTIEFPTTNDGKFYSAKAAMRDIGKVGDE